MRYDNGVLNTSWLVGALVLGVACVGCDDHVDCPTGDPGIASLALTPDTVSPGDTVTGKVSVVNFQLSGEEGDSHTQAEPLGAPGLEPLHGDETSEGGECTGGHVHVYLDDLMTEPLTQATLSEFTFTVPDDTPAGAHTIIGRLHLRDHFVYEPQVTFETDLMVQ